MLGIYRVQSMLCINKSGNSASFLYLSHHMQRHGGLTAGFRTVDLYDPSFRDASQTQCNVKAERTCRYCLHIHMYRGIAQFHNRAFTKLLLNLSQGRVQGF